MIRLEHPRPGGMWAGSEPRLEARVTRVAGCILDKAFALSCFDFSIQIEKMCEIDDFEDLG